MNYSNIHYYKIHEH